MSLTLRYPKLTFLGGGNKKKKFRNKGILNTICSTYLKLSKCRKKI